LNFITNRQVEKHGLDQRTSKFNSKKKYIKQNNSTKQTQKAKKQTKINKLISPKQLQDNNDSNDNKQTKC